MRERAPPLLCLVVVLRNEGNEPPSFGFADSLNERGYEPSSFGFCGEGCNEGTSPPLFGFADSPVATRERAPLFLVLRTLLMREGTSPPFWFCRVPCSSLVSAEGSLRVR
jgi:hypothetical protein